MGLARKFLCLSLCIPLCLINATVFACDSLVNLSWLHGQWRSETEQEWWTEQWHIVSPHTMEGMAGRYSKTAKDKESSETMRIVQMEDELFYFAKVAENNLPIAFKAITCEKHQVVFHNPDHDFPKSLDYALIKKDTLRVVIAAGRENSFTLEFKKTN